MRVRTVEAHVKQIFLKLHLNANPGSHRRVLAVLAYLRGPRRNSAGHSWNKDDWKRVAYEPRRTTLYAGARPRRHSR
jgi:hypothetical protein